jgi:hypothetical protein
VEALEEAVDDETARVITESTPARLFGL